MNDEYSNEKSLYKTPEEIKDIIKNALVSNKILGYLNGNILYMKSFGKDYSLDKILFIIGAVVLLGGFEAEDLFFNYWFIILPLGIGSLIIGFVLNKLLKFYLIYDIDREVFYTITSVFNNTLYMTDDINIRDFIELGVDVSDKNPGNDNQVNSNVIYFKGDIMDNPGLRTSFVALRPNGKLVNISDPVALREPHKAAVARCKMFAECFGLDCVICNKNEGLKVVNENNGFKLSKYNKEQEWAKAKKNNNISLIVVFSILIITALIVFFVIK